MIFASLLNADFGCLADEVAQLEQTGLISGLHIDVMDGHFVPNLAIGPQVVSALRDRTKLPMEVHLMVSEPSRILPMFADTGVQRAIVHAEACPHLHRDLAFARDHGLQTGVALNPATPIGVLEHVLDEIDEVLLMGVNPGFGGQGFIPPVFQKTSACRQAIDQRGSPAKINIDGGVKVENAARLLLAGAHWLVVGSALFTGNHIAQSTRRVAAAIGACV
ncbi:MAG TPA: ribulose-phosphate 3-epimerase [Candidatus Baltobacteraceae bacterium]|nr:ribulose-phosphate 3-epimerase [Candidatus Baltobacteraceae bacterium]